MLRIALLFSLTIIVALAVGCAAFDHALLEPERNEDGEALYLTEDGEEITESERDELPPEEREKTTPKYDGPKDHSDWGVVPSIGVGVAGVLGVGSAIWWWIRRRRSPG